MPRGSVRAAAAIVVCFELLLALALIVPATRLAALLGSAVLLIVYAAAIAINLLRGRRHIDCGCMGPAGRQMLSGWLVTRNFVIALAAVLAATPVASRALSWIDVFTTVASVVVLALAYTSVNHVIANAPQLARLRQGV